MSDRKEDFDVQFFCYNDDGITISKATCRYFQNIIVIPPYRPIQSIHLHSLNAHDGVQRIPNLP